MASRRGNLGDRAGGTLQPHETPPPGAPPADHYAALRQDVVGLEEVCRWQWQLIQQLRQHLGRLPETWPEEPGPS